MALDTEGQAGSGTTVVRDGDGPRPDGHNGDRPSLTGEVRLADVGSLELELGAMLDAVVVAYETWGRLNANRDNALLLLHSLTGDSHAVGPVGPGHPTPGWWDPLIGPGAAIDTDRWFVVCPNVLGGCRGTTGPSSLAPDGIPYGSRFPTLTIRDLVTAELALSRLLGIERWAGVVGASLGGMRALEWSIMAPAMVQRTIAIATEAAATAEQVALASTQMRAIRQDPKFRGGDYYAFGDDGPSEGMALARQFGFVGYRSELELHQRFGLRRRHDDDRIDAPFAIEIYLEHQGARIVERFDANSYIVLSQAMNLHDIGRGRGGVARALGLARSEATIVSIDSDRLYPPRLQRELFDLWPRAARWEEIHSLRGHDAFLAEYDQLGAILRRALDGPSVTRAGRS